MLGERLESGISDVAFTNAYRVPFQYRDYLRKHFAVASLVEESADVRVKDSDGNWSYDLTGSYGVNVFGYDFYKDCIDAGAARVRALGPVLGAYHPIIEENVRRLREISRLDEVSFPHVGHRGCDAGRAARAIPHGPTERRALLRRVSRLVGRRATRRRQPAASDGRLHARRR